MKLVRQIARFVITTWMWPLIPLVGVLFSIYTYQGLGWELYKDLWKFVKEGK